MLSLQHIDSVDWLSMRAGVGVSFAVGVAFDAMISCSGAAPLNRLLGPANTSTTPVSGFKALAHLLPLDELLRLWEPQKRILRTIWGL